MANSAPDAMLLVDRILADAAAQRASDVHFEPTADGLEVRFRVDGLLGTIGHYDAPVGRSLVNRLMVLGHLLTYRIDVPQEGRVRIALPPAQKPVEMRLAIIPTTNGLRAAVRMPAELVQPHTLEQLGLPQSLLDGLRAFAATDAGMLLMTGPAGSGKTTAIYALLEYIARTSPGLSIVTLEDPVERNIPGLTQIEVRPMGELTYERALRSILRQDPQVLMLGEIRDAATATLAVQAALSGHRLISTLHAGTPAGAIARLMEMGLEPYQITSALWGVAALRLLRRTNEDTDRNVRATGRETDRNVCPTGTETDKNVRATRYAGRIPVGELVTMDGELRAAILGRADSAILCKVYEKPPTYISMRSVAQALIARGVSDEAEVQRVLGAQPGA